MLNKNQIISLKNIYQLFNNISDAGSIWMNELKENDEVDIHIEKLSVIMNLISNINEKIDGELDDIIIIVEENLKDYIMEKYAEDNENEDDTETDEEYNYN